MTTLLLHFYLHPGEVIANVAKHIAVYMSVGTKTNLHISESKKIIDYHVILVICHD